MPRTKCRDFGQIFGQKLRRENITQSYLTSRMELLENYWLQVIRIHNVLQGYDNIVATEYMEKDIYAETENQYTISTKSKIRDFLKGGDLLKDLPKNQQILRPIAMLNIEILICRRSPFRNSMIIKLGRILEICL